MSLIDSVRRGELQPVIAGGVKPMNTGNNNFRKLLELMEIEGRIGITRTPIMPRDEFVGIMRGRSGGHFIMDSLPRMDFVGIRELYTFPLFIDEMTRYPVSRSPLENENIDYGMIKVKSIPQYTVSNFQGQDLSTMKLLRSKAGYTKPKYMADNFISNLYGTIEMWSGETEGNENILFEYYLTLQRSYTSLLSFYIWSGYMYHKAFIIKKDPSLEWRYKCNTVFYRKRVMK